MDCGGERQRDTAFGLSGKVAGGGNSRGFTDEREPAAMPNPPHTPAEPAPSESGVSLPLPTAVQRRGATPSDKRAVRPFQNAPFRINQAAPWIRLFFPKSRRLLLGGAG
jgi:hypothetical protein